FAARRAGRSEWESLIKYVLGEMRVIADARLVFATALLVAGMAIYWVMDWRYVAILSNRDSEIALLKSQRDDYKDKLGGASPDQARARIDALESRLAQLEPKLENRFARLEPRRITPEQRATFIQAINVNKGTALVWSEIG